LKSGQIVKGKLDGVQKKYQSIDLPQITNERLAQLTDNSQIGTFYHYFKAERIVGGMIVTEAEDTDGRRGGTVKHIILHQYDHSKIHDGEQYLFDHEEFIAKWPRQFKMPPFPTILENPLPPPPPLEWSVP
jgi:hypothetical protein